MGDTGLRFRGPIYYGIFFVVFFLDDPFIETLETFFFPIFFLALVLGFARVSVTHSPLR